jgi:hypothetical protein
MQYELRCIGFLVVAPLLVEGLVYICWPDVLCANWVPVGRVGAAFQDMFLRGNGCLMQWGVRGTEGVQRGMEVYRGGAAGHVKEGAYKGRMERCGK